MACEDHRVYYCFGLARNDGSPSCLRAALRASGARFEKVNCRVRAGLLPSLNARPWKAGAGRLLAGGELFFAIILKEYPFSPKVQ
jgi:hypothetical protein